MFQQDLCDSAPFFFFYHDMFLYTFGVTSQACWCIYPSGNKKLDLFDVCQADVKMLWDSCNAVVPFRAALATD